MRSAVRIEFHTIAGLGFLVLFPGFVLYHFLISVGTIPPVLGGLFGGATAAFAVVALIQLAIQFRSQGSDVSLLQLSFVLFCGFFFMWVLVAGAVSPRRLTVMAAVLESLATLVIWLAVFFVGSRIKLDAGVMRVAIPVSAVVLLILFVYAVAREGSFLGPFLLFEGGDETGNPESGAATYQAVGRSILIVGLVVAALQTRFWKQAVVMSLVIAALLSLGSRAHLFSAVLCMVALVVVVGLRRGQRAAVFLFAAGAIAISYVSVEVFLDTRASEILDLATSTSWQARLELQQRALQVIAENLMTGEFGYHHWGAFAGYAHNVLSAWAGFGVVVFLAYLGLMVCALGMAVKRALSKRAVDPLWLLSLQTNMVALILAVASEPIFASVIPALGWGVTVNALLQERRRKVAARTALDVAVRCAKQPIEWPTSRFAGLSS